VGSCFRAKLCRLVGIEAEPLLQGVDHLLHRSRSSASSWKIQCLAWRSKIAWKISWNHSFREASKLLARNGAGSVDVSATNAPLLGCCTHHHAGPNFAMTRTRLPRGHPGLDVGDRGAGRSTGDLLGHDLAVAPVVVAFEAEHRDRVMACHLR
jgi:hypothetical protein